MQSKDDNIDLIAFTKLAVSQIFNNDEIGQHIYNVFIEEEFDQQQDILNDLLNYNECTIINTISIQLSQDNNINWTENDNKILYKILLIIFRDKETNINKLFQQFSHYYHSSSSQSQQSFIIKFDTNKLMVIAAQITQKLNESLSKPIEIENVKQLFEKEDINGIKLLQLSIIEFCQLAKKYAIPSAKATKLYQEIKNCNDSDSV